MKSLIKDLLQNPIMLSILLGVGFIYFILFYHYISRNQKFNQTLEKIIAGLFISLLIGLTITPFTLLSPGALAAHSSIRPIASSILQLAIYVSVLIILSSRLRHTIKDSLFVFSVVLTKSPFFCLLLLIIALSGLWSDTPGETLKASLAILGTTFVCIYIGKQYSWPELAGILRWSYTTILFVSMFYSIAKPSIGIGIKGWKGITGHENVLGALMAVTVIMWFLRIAPSQKRFFQPAIMAFLAIVVLQNANTAGAKVILLWLLALLLFLRYVKRLPFQWAFVAVIIFMVLLSCVSLLIGENLAGILGALGKDMTLTGRTDVWPDIMKAIRERPLVGYGYYGFWQKWRGFENPAYHVISPSGWRPPHAHNGFLDIALDLGLLGLVCFVLSFLSNVAKGIQYMSRSQTSEAVLPLVLLTYTVLTNLSETGFLGFSLAWCYHVLCTVRLSLDTTEKGLIKERSIEAYISYG